MLLLAELRKSTLGKALGLLRLPCRYGAFAPAAPAEGVPSLQASVRNGQRRRSVSVAALWKQKIWSSPDVRESKAGPVDDAPPRPVDGTWSRGRACREHDPGRSWDF